MNVNWKFFTVMRKRRKVIDLWSHKAHNFWEMYHQLKKKGKLFVLQFVWENTKKEFISSSFLVIP